MKPVTQPKDCPKCGLTLRGEYDSRWCQNGCDILTAAPVGSPFTVQAMDSEGPVFNIGGGLRRNPHSGEYGN